MPGIIPEKYQDYMHGKISYADATGQTPTPAPSVPAPPMSSGSSNPFANSGYGSSYTPSSYSAPAPSYANVPALSYSGQANIIGNVSGSNDFAKSIQDISQQALAANPSKNSHGLGTWTDNSGNVYDITDLTPQQSYALQLSKNGNPNAGSILSGMGLDMNGNPTSPNVPAPQMPTTASSSSSGGSYGGGSSTPMPQASVPAPSYPGQLTPSQIQAEAQARIDKQRAALAQSVGATVANLKNTYDYQNQLTNDRRTMENQSFQRNNNPFSGQTDYLSANLARDRSIQDAAANKDYAANVAAAQQKLTDFDTLAPEQQQALVDQLTRQERDYGVQVGQQTGYLPGYGQTLAGRAQDANYTGYYGGAPTMQLNNQNFNQAVQGSQLTGYFDPYAAQKQQMQANSAAWFNASPDEKQRLATENQRIGASIGATQNANGDWVFPQTQRTLAGQDADLRARQQTVKDAMDRTNAFGSVSAQDAAILGVPAGTKSTDAILKNAQAQYYMDHGQYYDARAGMGGGTGGGSTLQQQHISNLMKVWENTGTAPDGLQSIGVQPGTPLKSNGQPAPKKNQVESQYVSNIEKMTPENRAKFFKEEKSSIIDDLGISGYNQLYNTYFDQWGTPK